MRPPFLLFVLVAKYCASAVLRLFWDGCWHTVSLGVGNKEGGEDGKTAEGMMGQRVGISMSRIQESVQNTLLNALQYSCTLLYSTYS